MKGCCIRITNSLKEVRNCKFRRGAFSDPHFCEVRHAAESSMSNSMVRLLFFLIFLGAPYLLKAQDSIFFYWNDKPIIQNVSQTDSFFDLNKGIFLKKKVFIDKVDFSDSLFRIDWKSCITCESFQSVHMIKSTSLAFGPFFYRMDTSLFLSGSFKNGLQNGICSRRIGRDILYVNHYLAGKKEGISYVIEAHRLVLTQEYRNGLADGDCIYYDYGDTTDTDHFGFTNENERQCVKIHLKYKKGKVVNGVYELNSATLGLMQRIRYRNNKKKIIYVNPAVPNGLQIF